MSDMSYIRGQEHVKRAMENAAAGAHNITYVMDNNPPILGLRLLRFMGKVVGLRL